MSAKNADGTAALDKALDVLDAVGSAPDGLGQAELAARLALPRTTLYRLLGTLVARGLLRRDPLRRVYCLGFRCFEYARAAYAMPDLVAAAGVELRALRDMSGETSYLATRDGLEVVSLERCDGAHSLRSQSALGQRKPLHCTSQGKAILAAMPPEQRDSVVRDLVLGATTPRSITDRRRLLAELRLTATRGWAIDDEEIVPGVRCCGAAIVDTNGVVRGAISVAGPAYRLTMERLALLGPEVAEAARRVGAQLSATQTPGTEGEAVLVPGEWAFMGRHPVWSQQTGALFWADALAPAVHLATAEGDALIAGLATDAAGGEAKGTVDPHGAPTSPAAAPIQALLPQGAGVVVQIGMAWHALDAQGRWAGLGAGGDRPQRKGTAHALGPDGRTWTCLPDGERWRVSPLTSDGQAAGGWRLPEPATALAWDATGQVLHIAAAESGTLYTAQLGSSNLRRLATVPKGSGRLGGLALDEQGGLWCALSGGWSVARFDASGALDRVVALPVPCPTDLGFGGEDGGTLFITTGRDALSRDALEAAPASGRLFALHGAGPGVMPGRWARNPD